ncbi:Hypothetical protein D9617_7g030690 [Elsinoe fawcettii]|nr:Hypothetical protein D9617_7g030690 [Elsinoe fawcettii]
MGLPIWRDPEEKDTKDTVRTDPTAVARSPIRRRPSMSRGNFPRHPRWTSLLERSHPGSPPPPPAMSPPPPLPVPSPMSSRIASVRDRLHTIRSAYQPRPERDMRSEYLNDYLRGPRSPPVGQSSSERRTFLPTPPLDVSEQTETVRIDAGIPTISVQPATGLGDRVRSLSPTTPHDDAWQIMRETIPADGALPSADSSFTSAAVSASFTSTADAPDTQSTAPDHLADPNSHSPAGSPLPLDCPYDSDSDGPRSTPSTLSPLPTMRDVYSLRAEMEGNFAAMQDQHEASSMAYEDELTSLRDDFNSLRDRLRQIDPTATLPPPYPTHGSYHTTSHDTSRRNLSGSHSRGLTTPRTFHYPPAYDPAIHSRSRDAVSRTEEYFLPHSRHEPYGQYHLGVDRDGQLQLLPRDRTLTRVPSLRREDPQRESHDRVREHLRERAEGQMRDQTRRSLAAAGFTPEQVDRISDPRSPGERLRDGERRRQELIFMLQQREAQRQRDGERTGEDAASDVDSMRGILDRLSRRQDVPEGMWMGAGLSRDVVEPRADGPIEAARVTERGGMRDGEGAEGREAGSGRAAGRGRLGRVQSQL